MKVILDANIWISYLLDQGAKGTIQTVVNVGISGAVQLVLPEELLQELHSSVVHSQYLRTRIPEELLSALVDNLRHVAWVPPTTSSTTSLTSRDRHDDYLLMYGVIHRVDYLVTGDHDLLILKKFRHLKMISPAQFIVVLQNIGLVGKP